MEQELLYDVIAYDLATKAIVRIFGVRLPLNGNHTQTAKECYADHETEIDPKNYGIDIVPAGLFEKGGIYK